MKPHDYFSGEIADRYDESLADRSAPSLIDLTVAVLTDLADAGAALEFGIGTGRIALPLAARGVAVRGIDLSPDMAARLQEKSGGRDIPVSIGDFASTRVAGSFSLVYLVFNTIMNLTTQENQVRCFRNAASHLCAGGRFVVEVMVPDLRRLPPGETIRPFEFTTAMWGFDEYDVATQGLTSHHLEFEGETTRRRSIPFRYVWPSELDLMARIAGLEREHRWADWDRSPFTGDSRSHISVYRKTAEE